MISTLWTGIAGLSSQQTALDNESNNIANVNTVGYKSSRVSFADLMYQDSIGKGSKVTTAEKQFTQGSLNITGSSYDMALNGDGFFVVSNKSSTGTSENYYTRAGNFRMGENGTLQDSNGNEVQGWALSAIDSEADVTSTNE
jgi:flagellar hook protein FlgE